MIKCRLCKIIKNIKYISNLLWDLKTKVYVRIGGVIERRARAKTQGKQLLPKSQPLLKKIIHSFFISTKKNYKRKSLVKIFFAKNFNSCTFI